jgi:hypothetical protein
MMHLLKQQFETIDEVNDTIHPLLIYLDERRFQKMPCSQASCFAQIDSPALQPLPAQAWEFAVFKTVRVHVDQHVEFESHYYSVPQSLVGLRLELRVTARSVELLHQANALLATLALRTPAAALTLERT